MILVLTAISQLCVSTQCALCPASVHVWSQVINSFVSVLEHEACKRGDATFSTEELRRTFEQAGLVLQRASFTDFVDELNVKNHLLKKGPGKWKLQASVVGLSQR